MQNISKNHDVLGITYFAGQPYLGDQLIDGLLNFYRLPEDGEPCVCPFGHECDDDLNFGCPFGEEDDPHSLKWGFITPRKDKTSISVVDLASTHAMLDRYDNQYEDFARAIQDFFGGFISWKSHRLVPTPYVCGAEEYQGDFDTLIRRNPDGSVTSTIVDSESDSPVITIHFHQPVIAVG